MTDAPTIISADDHVIEPPDLWQSRLPQRLRAEGPRVVEHPRDAASYDKGANSWRLHGDGTAPPAAFWHYEDKIKPMQRNEASAGFEASSIDMTPVSFEEIRPGCWQPAARLEDMTINGIAASMCFPNYPRFSGQLFSEGRDRELGLACIRAYNDWMVEEWCGDSGGRLIPLCIIPLWDAELAAAEVRRNAERGVRAVSFSEIPAWLGVPSIHSGFWDPFFRACDETQTVVAMHIGSGSRIITSSDDAPFAVQAVMIFNNSATSMVDFLCSGVLARFPDLKLFYAEAQIGWIPYVLERADDTFHRQRWLFPDNVDQPPSSYYHHRVFSCFFSDPVGIALLDRVGVDQVLFETDYPHETGTWPSSESVARAELGHLDPVDRDKILRANAVGLFGLSV
ncbi:MAG: amidohydrolase family protein [Acidimicrobiales bacterium]